ncbi:MutS-related protein [Spirosoma rhododendri]|uniref:DNA mismatch repair protein MutS n=1 Tax=Spirosoma rhododendri TaxID=2728024 RepID=A0A7L5DHT4_9BACT|nr:DNA mismatch repair protein MutS [Spirosoma rhododendri]QJD77924.1 DNA mismatch repair protein MutS [Spirosoma rhododendri]
MPIDTDAVFQQRQQTFLQQEQDAQQRHNRLATGRLLWFAVVAVATWLLGRAGQEWAAVAVLIVGVVGFLILLRKHQAIRRERDLARQLAFINEDESARLRRQYRRPETGELFASATHPYAGDLDVFGAHSLFRLLNRTHTREGQIRLATWLLNPSTADTIRLRQEAAQALVPQLDWRQQFEALARIEETIGRSPESLIGWAEAPHTPVPGYVNAGRFALPVATVALFVAWLTGYVPGAAVLTSLAVSWLALRQTTDQVRRLSEQTAELATALKTVNTLFVQAEQVPGEAIRLKAIRQALSSHNQKASDAVRQLASLAEGLNFRLNPYFYLFFGVASLWDWHYLSGLNRWRQQHGTALRRWFDALGELEALNSLAGFAYAHPAYARPTITDGELRLELEAASHPLLPPNRSVANSLTMANSGQTILITGSNMSGKSTFLRTVGANVVLALAGAVVSADRFSCSVVQVFTSMRTQDSLEESTSSFYAELKRLQALITLTNTPSTLPVLYFLDEILKGTNSADRHRGAEALIRQLHKTTASGFVSTHDLELGQLTNAADFIRNYHFQSDLRDGELLFDYQLRPGVCTAFNASQLMQAIGIQMNL